jgi:predicted  nucleic acid-binding Zn-ribbon protein
LIPGATGTIHRLLQKELSLRLPQKRTMSDEEEDFNLYGDLQDTKCAPKNTSSHEMQELKDQVEKLQAENETLRRNIGTLFRTARAEIRRKDSKIESLMEELDRASTKP